MDKMTETVTLEMIYEEILALRKLVESLAVRMLPVEELDPEELAELKLLIEESKTDSVSWEQVKSELKAKNLL